MKRIYKIFLCSLFFVFLFSSQVNADQMGFTIVSASNSDYKVNVTMVNTFDKPDDYNAYIGKKLNAYAPVGVVIKGDIQALAKFTWENPDYIIVSGEQYANLICTYLGERFTVKVCINGVEMPAKIKVPVSIDERDVVPEDEEAIAAEEITPPSLTTTSVVLATATAYDINIVDSTAGTKYTWTSSNTSIATVNPKNGIVRAVKPGKATITCKATLPNGKVETLTSEVSVGYDENAPILTDESLDLSINDTFDINVENRIAKSKYKYASSDWSKVRVNSATGKIRAVGEGSAFVTCTITTPENQVIVLKCDITISK
jgi:hypothetical protein